MNISQEIYGQSVSGKEITLFTLENDNNVKLKITNFGGIITHLFTPDRDGKSEDIVLGFDDLSGYQGEHPYFGAIIGRFANRIAEGKFSLEGKIYKLEVNNGPNHLHGGIEGFDKKIWTSWIEKKADELTLKLAYESKHMEEGYPGNLLVEVLYTLNNDNELIIDYRAESDRDTILNLTNHSYFNLKSAKGDVLDHYLKMDCSKYTPVDENSIPVGEIKPVSGSAFDFTREKQIGEDFDKLENGYDHNFVIDKKENEFKWFAKVTERYTGRTLEVGTTQPGVQFYTANFLDGITGKNNIQYKPQHAFCLETQGFPDSPNKPSFPSPVLRKGEHYSHKTVYKFGIEE
jgi:aldose 1-epimerase